MNYLRIYVGEGTQRPYVRKTALPLDCAAFLSVYPIHPPPIPLTPPHRPPPFFCFSPEGRETFAGHARGGSDPERGDVHLAHGGAEAGGTA